jgi:hypothetical protein
MRIHATLCAAGVLMLFFSAPANAALSVTSLGTPLLINFDSSVSGVESGAFAGIGFAPHTTTAGQLDSDAFAVQLSPTSSFAFDGTQTSGDYAKGTSSSGQSAGGIWAFNTATPAAPNIALGMKPVSGSNDFESGSIFLRIVNSLSVSLDQFTISYKIYVRNDQPGSSTVRFSSSSDNVSYDRLTTLDVVSPGSTDSLGWVASSRSTTLTGLNIAPGGFFYLQWNVFNTTNGPAGNKDELGLDDISVTAQSDQLVPEPVMCLTIVAAAGMWMCGRTQRGCFSKL